ncbi:MAG: C2 family cysteine protease [Myxococcales bacterium]
MRLNVGGASQVVTVDAGGKDTRRPEFNVQGLRLTEQGGAYAFTSVSKTATAGEPGEVVQLTNMRTQKKQLVTLDAQGLLPAGTRISGQPGDVINFATTDGSNNADYKDDCGNVVILAPKNAASLKVPFEPAPLLEDRTKVQSSKLNGQLFVNGVSPTDPAQGGVGDCYLVASAASLAQMRPEVLEKMIKQNQDGTFTVTFKRYDAQAKAYVDDAVTVTNSFPNKYGQVTYGGSTQSGELWFSVLEKAYASWKGGYDAIRSGYPYEIFEATMGKAGKHLDPRIDSSDKVFKAIKTATDKKQPMVAWTAPDNTAKPFSGTGLVGDHAYTVMGAEEKDGKKFVTLRNPWACTEPTGNGKDDGVFTLPLETFVKYYDGVGIAQ